jgi:hypothetical protein
MRQSSGYEPKDPRDDDRRRKKARQRGLTLAVLVLVVIVVVVLVVVSHGGEPATSASSSSSTTSTLKSTTSTMATDVSLGSDSSDTTEATDGETTGTTTYTAELTGGNEVPAVETAASGTLTLTVSSDGTKVNYEFKVESIISLTVARLRSGAGGSTGPVILTIYKGPTKDGLHSGTIAKGSFTAKSFVGPLKGKTIDDLVAMIEQGEVYVNVGTEANPDGEIRGMLQ